MRLVYLMMRTLVHLPRLLDWRTEIPLLGGKQIAQEKWREVAASGTPEQVEEDGRMKKRPMQKQSQKAKQRTEQRKTAGTAISTKVEKRRRPFGD